MAKKLSFDINGINYDCLLDNLGTRNYSLYCPKLRQSRIASIKKTGGKMYARLTGWVWQVEGGADRLVGKPILVDAARCALIEFLSLNTTSE